MSQIKEEYSEVGLDTLDINIETLVKPGVREVEIRRASARGCCSCGR